jgi:structural maintenance of chromosome 4
MKGVTQQLRGELETKTQELAPVHQERAVFQARLDTALTQVQLLEGSTTRAKEKLLQAETELASIDQTQQSKREELTAAQDELQQAQERITQAEGEETVLATKEVQISQRNKDLLVRDMVRW